MEGDYQDRKEKERAERRDKRYDDEDREHKKKKKHKQNKHERTHSRSADKGSPHQRKKKLSKERSRSREKDKGHRDPYREKSNQYRRRSNSPRRDRKPIDEKDPYFEERRQIERVRRHNPEKSEKMEDDLQKKILIDRKRKELSEAQQKFKDAQKQMEEAKRQDHTILVYCLPLKAKQKDIWNHFYKAGIGKVRDIRIIKDSRSQKSKGVAYVEFYNSESVEKALTLPERPFELKGREFLGLRIQHSQAEKNRAAAVAKQMRVIKPVDPYEQAQEALKRQMKVLVGGLTGKLADVQQSDLKQIFDPFGQIDYVDIHRDAMTGKCKGFAFINYTNPENAKTAVKEMNGMQVAGQKITVQTVSVMQRGQVNAGQEYLYSQGSKEALMHKFARGGGTQSNLARPPISTVCTQYMLMTNTFKMDGTNPGYFEDLKKQVSTKCLSFGVVEKCFVEKNNQGNVWVKFSDSASATKAIEALNGKFFDNEKIFCYNVTEQTYQNRVGV